MEQRGFCGKRERENRQEAGFEALFRWFFTIPREHVKCTFPMQKREKRSSKTRRMSKRGECLAAQSVGGIFAEILRVPFPPAFYSSRKYSRCATNISMHLTRFKRCKGPSNATPRETVYLSQKNPTNLRPYEHRQLLRLPLRTRTHSNQA